MFWNHCIHALIGIFFPSLFLWTTNGVLAAAFTAVIVQAIDMVRMYFYYRSMALGNSASGASAEQKFPDDSLLAIPFQLLLRGNAEQIRDSIARLAWVFVLRVTWYGVVTLVAASVTRDWNAHLAAFIAVFVALAYADWWMDKVQRTVQLICRASGEALDTVGVFLNPTVIRFSLPITLAKWVWAAAWAWYGSAPLALFALFASWLITVASPTPFWLTIPSVLKKIEHVRALDSDFGNHLLQMVQTWKSIAARR